MLLFQYLLYGYCYDSVSNSFFVGKIQFVKFSLWLPIWIPVQVFHITLSHAAILSSHFLESFDLLNKFLRQCEKFLSDFLIERRIESCSDEFENEEGHAGHGRDDHRLPQEVNWQHKGRIWNKKSSSHDLNNKLQWGSEYQTRPMSSVSS